MSAVVELNNLKKILKALLVSSQSCGQSLKTLLQDYTNMEGRAFPYREFGYNSPVALLNAMPDSVVLVPQNGSLYVYPVGSKENEHVHKLIAEQRRPKKDSKWPFKKVVRRKIGRSLFFQNGPRISIYNAPTNMAQQNRLTRTPNVQQLSAPHQSTPNVYCNNTNQRYHMTNNVMPSTSNVLQHKTMQRSNCVISDYVQAPNEVDQLSLLSSSIEALSIKENCSSQQQKIEDILISETQANFIVDATQKPIVSGTDSVPLNKEPSITISNYCQSDTISLVKNGILRQSSVSTKSISYDSFSDNRDLSSEIIIDLSDEKNDNGGSNNNNNNKSTMNDKNSSNDTKIKSLNSAATEDSRLIKTVDDLDDALLSDDSFALLDIENEFVDSEFDEKLTVPDWIKVGSSMKFSMAEVHSPYKFWFHLCHENDVLTNLMEALDSFYNNINVDEMKTYRLPMKYIKIGQICAVRYQEIWHRAKIVDVLEDETVKVFYFDYGTVDETSINNLQFLKKHFTSTPALAIRGCLDNVKPMRGLWSLEAINEFYEIVLNRCTSLYAKVTTINKEEQTVFVNLIDTAQKDDVDIAALLIEQNQGTFVKKPLDHWVRRHYSVVYPTFEMLENGEYLSLADINEYKNKGFDFFQYEQSIINPKMYGYSAMQ